MELSPVDDESKAHRQYPVTMTVDVKVSAEFRKFSEYSAKTAR
jgi:hypothetical protein